MKKNYFPQRNTLAILLALALAGCAADRMHKEGYSLIEEGKLEEGIAKLEEAGLLYLVMERFKNIDLHPDKVSNLEMGYIFEELVRKFNEALNENPGEHFTPREAIRLMAQSEGI